MPGPRPGPGGLPAGLHPRRRRRRAVRRALARGGAAVRRGGQAQPGVLRGVRVGRDRRPRADPGRASRRRAGHRRREARRHRLDRGAPGRRPCSTRSAPTRSRSTRTSARRRSRRSSSARDRFAYVLCRTSNPGAGELQDLGRRGRRRRRARRPSRSTRASPGAPPAWGPGGTVGLVVGATAPAELAAIRAIAPGSGVPGPGRRGPGRRASSRSSRTARRPRRRPAGDPAAACSSTCRAASPGGARRAGTGAPGDLWSGSRRPPPTGPRASLCYPSRRREGPIAAPAHEDPLRHDADSSDPSSSIIILVIALLILGPGKLPDVGAALGKSIREFRKASSDVQEAVKVDTSPLPPTPRRARPRARAPPLRPPRRRAARPPCAAPAAVAARRRRARRGRGRARRAAAAPDRRRSSELDDPSRARRRRAPRHGRRRRPARRRRVPALPVTPDRAARRPRPRRDETVMSLVDHLGELRTRLVPRRSSRSSSAAVVGFYFARDRSAIVPRSAAPEPSQLQVLGPRRRVRHPAQDRPRRRDHPGDAGDPLPAVGVHRARA